MFSHVAPALGAREHALYWTVGRGRQRACQQSAERAASGVGRSHRIRYQSKSPSTNAWSSRSAGPSCRERRGSAGRWHERKVGAPDSHPLRQPLPGRAGLVRKEERGWSAPRRPLKDGCGGRPAHCSSTEGSTGAAQAGPLPDPSDRRGSLPRARRSRPLLRRLRGGRRPQRATPEGQTVHARAEREAGLDARPVRSHVPATVDTRSDGWTTADRTASGGRDETSDDDDDDMLKR